MEITTAAEKLAWVCAQDQTMRGYVPNLEGLKGFAYALGIPTRSDTIFKYPDHSDDSKGKAVSILKLLNPDSYVSIAVAEKKEGIMSHSHFAVTYGYF